MSLGDGEAIVDVGDPGRTPGGEFGLMLRGPTGHVSGQSNLGAVDSYLDVVCFEFSISPQSFKYVRLCVLRRDDDGNGLKFDEIVDCSHTRDRRDGVLRGDALNEQYGDAFRVFKGTECDILPDGSLDFPDDLLAGFDYVVASVHSSFGQPREEMTRRLST